MVCEFGVGHLQEQSRCLRLQFAGVNPQAGIRRLNGNRMAVPFEAWNKTRDEDQAALTERGWVDQQNVSIHMPGNGLEGGIADLGHIVGEFGVLGLQLFINRANAGARDNVVELVQADGLPGLAEIIGGVGVGRVEQGSLGGEEKLTSCSRNSLLRLARLMRAWVV